MNYSNRINELEYALGINTPLQEALKAMRIEPIRKKRLLPHFSLRDFLCRVKASLSCSTVSD